MVRVNFCHFIVAINTLVHSRSVSAFQLNSQLRFSSRRFYTSSNILNMHGQQQQNNGSGRRVSASNSEARAPNVDKSNRLFSVLKGGVPPVLSQASIATSASDGAASAEPKAGGGRKRNRSKSTRNESDTKKAAVQPSAGHTEQVAVSNNGGAMHVDSEEDAEKPSYLTDHLFNNLAISENSKRGLIEKMNIRYMTVVQHESLADILKGLDVLVKAKTGTGKTLAFLVPSIEVLIKERSRVELANRAQGREQGRPVGIPPAKILVLSPTRELAQQIVQEATALCTHHNIGCVLLVGGTNMNSDVRALARNGEGHNDIIVATPGRMLAHLKETPGFAEQVKGVKVFIMDEADRLLDMGFKKDIDQITNFLNQRNSNAFGKRQTLLFSATVAPEIREIARSTLLPGYKVIDTVGEEVEQTHSHVPQMVMCAPLEDQLKVIVQLLEQHKAANTDGYKIIMFFATARQTGYYASVLNSIGMPALEIHSRKSQGHRTKVSDQFRAGKNMIMCSSDVSARGMDYPDVSFVLQVGMTDRDQYIHRLGRTARAGKSGTGLLLLAPFEFDYMTKKELSDLPLQHADANVVLPRTASPLVARAVATVRELAAREEEAGDGAFGEDSERDGAKMAWQAWLGYYNSQCKKLNITKEQLVVKSAEYAATIGLPQLPALQKKTIGKMGLQGVAGLRIEAPSKSAGGQQGGRGGQQGGRGGNNQQQGQQQQPAPRQSVPQQSATQQSAPQQPRPQSRPAGRGDARGDAPRTQPSAGGRGRGNGQR